MAGITEKTINFIKSVIGARAKDSETPRQPTCLVIKGFPPDTFHVVECRVEGKLNHCYSVDATLVSNKADIDMKQLVHSSAFAFAEGRTGGYITFGGFVHEAEQMGSFSGKYFYRLMLAPKLFLLTQTMHNQVFLNKTTRQILEDILTDGGLQWDDFEFRLQNSYDKEWEYVCQYNESHFNFFSRWLEREGLYFFFEPTDNGEKLIITDTKMSHPAPDPKHKLRYKPVSGLNHDPGTPVLESFSSTHKRTPGSVTVKDYNYRHPSLDLSATETIDENNSGEVYIYGDHLQKPEESKRIAKVRAEGIKCRSHQFKGASNAGFLRSGSIIEVADHFRPEYNGKYLITEITHEINQQMYLVSGLQQGASERESKPAYRNTFTAIPADVQFRPLHITTRPRFHGVINAHIESEGKGNVPYLDKQGRYKVRLPFDQSERKSAKASAWLRMAQPYSGDGHGMHFPLLAGAEVLLTFIDGDPDRPIISAAVPNHANQSVVNENNNTQNRITTAGGNKLHIEDGDGSQRILMQSPTKNSWFRMGAPNDPPEGDNGDDDKDVELGYDDDGGFKLFSAGGYTIKAHHENRGFIGESTETIGGAESSIVAGLRNHMTLGLLTELVAGYKFEVGMGGGQEFNIFKSKIHEHEIEFALVNEKLSEAHTAITGICKKIGGAISDTFATSNKVALVKNEAASAATTLQAEESKTAVQSEALLASEVKLATTSSSSVAAQQDVAGSSMEVVEVKTEQTGAKTESVATETKQAGVSTEIGTTKTVIEELVAHL